MDIYKIIFIRNDISQNIIITMNVYKFNELIFVSKYKCLSNNELYDIYNIYDEYYDIEKNDIFNIVYLLPYYSFNFDDYLLKDKILQTIIYHLQKILRNNEI